MRHIKPARLALLAHYNIVILSYLLDDSKLYEHVIDDNASLYSRNSILRDVLRNQEPRFPVNIGITGYVASTGEVSVARNVQGIFILLR